jgi:hypothetical protein
VWYLLGVALSKQGAPAASACLAFWRAAQLSAASSSPRAAAQQPERPGHDQSSLDAAAADNCWLLSSKLLPPGWIAAAADQQLQDTLCAGAAHACAAALATLQRDWQQAAAQRPPLCATGSPQLQFVAAGGLGLQALQLPAALDQAAALVTDSSSAGNSNADSDGEDGGSAPAIALAFVPGGALEAHLGAQLIADNDLEDSVAVVSWQELAQELQVQQEQQQQVQQAAGGRLPAVPVHIAALLVGAASPDWRAAVSACISGCRGLAAAAAAVSLRTAAAAAAAAGTSVSLRTAAGGAHGSAEVTDICAITPTVLRVWAVPVSCAALLQLNEVDAPAMAAATNGAYDYSQVNRALRRPARPAQVDRYAPCYLCAPVLLLELHLDELLSATAAAQQRPLRGSGNGPGSQSAAAGLLAAKLAAGQQGTVCAQATVSVAGSLDAVVWWTEVQFAPGRCVSHAPASLSTTGGSSAGGWQPGAVRPHVWQQVQYLALPTAPSPTPSPQQQQEGQQDGQQQQQQLQKQQQQQLLCQGHHVEAGQRLLLRAAVSADALRLTVSALAHDNDQVAELSSLSSLQLLDPPPTQQQQQQQQYPCTQQQQQQQAAAGCTILPYHLSMLNDHDRTSAYQAGIAADVRALLQGGKTQPGGSKAASPAVVLDVGAGTGLLSMMAATAAAGVATTTTGTTTSSDGSRMPGCAADRLLVVGACVCLPALNPKP